MPDTIKLWDGRHIQTAQLEIIAEEPLASDLNMTLATWARPNGLYIYSHPRRLTEA